MNYYRGPGTAWQLRVCRGSQFSLYFDVAPNWFHRVMHRLILGFRWTRV